MISVPTVLVVEDDRSLMQGIRDILELQGYSVLTACSGMEGIELMHAISIPPDLIVSDIMMPLMNGYDFFRAVRKESHWTGIPFIFLTAKGEKHDIRLGKMLGVDDYVTKPFEAEDLIVVVASKLRRHQELQKLYNAQIGAIKRNILTILNHEFRTPLTYIVAYADMLNRDTDSLTVTELKTFVRGINVGAERLRRLVENFILLVELESDEALETYSWRKHEFNDYDGLLCRAAEFLQAFADERKVYVQVTPTPIPLHSVIGDTEYLQAALIRLVDNAIKFSQPNATVTLCAEVGDQEVLLNVIDHGRGIPPQEQTQIFDVFYQINRQTYEDQGAGAGLPIVERIAQMHGGTIKLHSVVGQGSTFSICLPFADSEPR